MPRTAELPNLIPAWLSIDVYRGDSFTLRAQMRTHGYPVDVSDWTFMSHIRDSANSETIIAIFDVYKLHPNIGVLQLLLTSDQSELLPSFAVWDLQTKSKGKVRTVIRGDITVMADVSREKRSINVRP